MLGRCVNCGFEAAACFIVGGKCHACRLPVGKDMMGAYTGKRVARLTEIIYCACGCGTKFNKWDSRNRARRYCDRRHQYRDAAREYYRRLAISKAQRAS